MYDVCQSCSIDGLGGWKQQQAEVARGRAGQQHQQEHNITSAAA
jgi:hypothetical protein